MKKQEWFANWFNSPYYHQLYAHRNQEEADVFIKKITAYLQLKLQNKVLDVACGKGRHSKALAECGFDVTGIDLAKDSIECAKNFESDTLHFFTHDMRLPFVVNYFDVVFNLFTSFGYFKTQREHNNTIRTLTNSLKTNGYLVIDYLNVHYEEQKFVPLIEKKIDNLNFIITKWQTPENFYKQIQVADSDCGIPRHLSTERVAKFSLGDFNEMLSMHDMQIQKVFGDYNLADYNLYQSKRMIIVAQKIERTNVV